MTDGPSRARSAPRRFFATNVSSDRCNGDLRHPLSPSAGGTREVRRKSDPRVDFSSTGADVERRGPRSLPVDAPKSEPHCRLFPSPKGSSQRWCSERHLSEHAAMIRILIAIALSENDPQGACRSVLARSAASSEFGRARTCSIPAPTPPEGGGARPVPLSLVGICSASSAKWRVPVSLAASKAASRIAVDIVRDELTHPLRVFAMKVRVVALVEPEVRSGLAGQPFERAVAQSLRPLGFVTTTASSTQPANRAYRSAASGFPRSGSQPSVRHP